MVTKPRPYLSRLYVQLHNRRLPADETVAGLAEVIARVLRDLGDPDKRHDVRRDRIRRIVAYWGCTEPWIDGWIAAYLALGEHGQPLIDWLEHGAGLPGPRLKAVRH